jgi:hypothetical protein
MIGVIDKGSHNPYPVAATGFLFGTCTTLWLFGIHVAQVARYYHRFGKEDRKRYKYALVPVVFGLSLLHIICILLAMYHYFVYGILEPRVWGSFYWVSALVYTPTTLLNSIVVVFIRCASKA